VAINPASSFGAHAMVGLRVAEELASGGASVITIVESSAEQLSGALRREISMRPDLVVAVGGDGLVSIVINALGDSNVPLAIVPTGTGNDLARGLGISREKPDAATARILAGLRADSIRHIDLGLAETPQGQRRFAGAVSVGFDARVNARANAMRRPRGALRYVFATLKELLGLGPLDVTITDSRGSETREVTFVTIANNRYIGGGMAIAPDAELSNGCLDVVTVAPLGRLKLLAFFPRVFAGTHTALEVIDVTRVHDVSISGPAVDAYADGERLGTLPVTVTVLPRALAVLA